jgi:DNA-directed RNA polymerase subunit RPC12/RpoP
MINEPEVIINIECDECGEDIGEGDTVFCPDCYSKLQPKPKVELDMREAITRVKKELDFILKSMG